MLDVYTQVAGTVVELHVKAGDIVEENDPVATIAAMKLELLVVAPGRGRVVRTSVKVGDPVESDTVLARIVLLPPAE